jgi:hypothetical protein
MDPFERLYLHRASFQERLAGLRGVLISALFIHANYDPMYEGHINQLYLEIEQRIARASELFDTLLTVDPRRGFVLHQAMGSLMFRSLLMFEGAGYDEQFAHWIRLVHLSFYSARGVRPQLVNIW